MSEPQNKTKSLEELTEKLSVLREEEDRLENEAHEWAEKRDSLNEKTKRLRAEVFELRGQRDRLNDEVKELKQRRNETTKKIREKLEDIKKFEEDRRMWAKKKPSKSCEALQKEAENIDWRIQTTPMTLQEDKESVGKVRELETQIAVYKKIEQLTKKIAQLRTEVNTMKADNKASHRELTENAQKSQDTHTRMLEKIEQSKTLRAEANDKHKQFLAAKEKTKPVRHEINAVLSRIRQLKGEIQEEDQRKQKLSQDALRKTLEKQAEEKLKRGEKLSWEEFQLLAEKGMADHD